MDTIFLRLDALEATRKTGEKAFISAQVDLSYC